MQTTFIASSCLDPSVPLPRQVAVCYSSTSSQALSGKQRSRRHHVPPTQMERLEELAWSVIVVTRSTVRTNRYTQSPLLWSLCTWRRPFGQRGEVKWNQPPAAVFQAEGLSGGVTAVKCSSHTPCLQGPLFITLNSRPYAALHCTLPKSPQWYGTKIATCLTSVQFSRLLNSGCAQNGILLVFIFSTYCSYPYKMLHAVNI